MKFDPEDGRLRVGRDGARLLVGDGERGDLMEEVSFMYASSDASSKRIYINQFTWSTNLSVTLLNSQIQEVILTWKCKRRT